MNKINKCDSCNNVYSHRQSQWRHIQNCNNNRIREVEQPIRKPQHLKRKNTCSAPYESETVMGTDVKQYVGSGKVHNQQHSKTLNPKFSALIDSIVDEEHSPKKKKKTIPPRVDLIAKIVVVDDDDDDDISDTDDDCSDDNCGCSDVYSRIEPVDTTGEDGRDEDKDEDEAIEEKDEDEDNGMPDPVTDPEEVLSNKIKDTKEYLIRYDKDEINKLLKKFLEVDENDDVLRLCELVETWIEKQVATEEEIPLDDIERILKKLSESSSTN